MLEVVVIEYGIGNVQSVVNAVRRLGHNVSIARSGEDILSRQADRIILPGVGAVGEALANIRAREIEDALEVLVIRKGMPFLGICVGMQVLAETCEEFGNHRGFGWIGGVVRRLAPIGSGLRLPHVGWNTVRMKAEDALLRDVNGSLFYFVHSYALQCPDEYVIGTTDYGGAFVSAIRHDNICAVQFHPEKSSRAGAALLRGFLDRGQ
jgi:glutamine amidotransferase